jgi:nucleotide-binding universal stress UspA family protein
MFTHILIATDGSELAGRAVWTGLDLANSLKAKVTFIVVTEPQTLLVPDNALAASTGAHDAALAKAASTILAKAHADAAKLGVVCETVHVANEFPAEAILREATARGCDAIVMASHGRRALARLLLGGETFRVVTHSAIPVIVCR